MLQNVQGNEEVLENLANTFCTGKDTETIEEEAILEKKRHKTNLTAEMKDSVLRNQQGVILQFSSAYFSIKSTCLWEGRRGREEE